jgi:hypothetical protein
VKNEEDSSIETWDNQGKTLTAGDKPSHLVWLNFEGGSVSSQESFIVRDAGLDAATLPSFSLASVGMDDASETARQDFITNVIGNLTSYFKDINVEFTTANPEVPCTSVYIGGSNFTSRPNIAGISPFDPGNFKDTDIDFVFPETLKDTAEPDKASLLAIAIAHEIGHSFGTRHIDNESAIMRAKIKRSTQELNEFGPYPENDGAENSKDVLIYNLGSRAENVNSASPALALLDVKSFANIAQFSVFNEENASANPDADLTKFRYIWEFEGESVEGPVVRVDFVDNDVHPLAVKVVDDGDNITGTYHFEIAKTPTQEP